MEGAFVRDMVPRLLSISDGVILVQADALFRVAAEQGFDLLMVSHLMSAFHAGMIEAKAKKDIGGGDEAAKRPV